MSQRYAVSVIVPIYQAESWLAVALDSLLRQTLNALQIILINDGSSDRSGEIAKGYCKRHPERFELVDLPNNLGISKVRNLGLKLAKGDYVGFVDSDDYVAPEMFELLYQAAEAGGCDWSSCRMSSFEQDPLLVQSFDLPEHYDDTFITNKLFKRELIERFQLEFYQGVIYEDEAFVYLFRFSSSRHAQLKQRLYHYRLNPKGACRSPARTRQNLFDKKLMLIRLLADLRQRELLDGNRAMMMQCLANHALSALYYHNTLSEKRGFFRFIHFLAAKYQLQPEPESSLSSDYKISRFYRFSAQPLLFALLIVWLPLKSLWQARHKPALQLQEVGS